MGIVILRGGLRQQGLRLRGTPGLDEQIEGLRDGRDVLCVNVLQRVVEQEAGHARQAARAAFAIDDDRQDIKLKAGWNLVSFKLTPSANDVDDVFVKEGDGSKLYSGVVWEFTGGRYVEADVVVAGKAYWLYSKSAATISVQGSASTDTISLEEGWNLIGPLCDVTDFVGTYKKAYADMYSKIANNDQGGLEIYEFVSDSSGNSSYGLAIEGGKYCLKVDKGYWIKANAATELPFIKSAE